MSKRINYLTSVSILASVVMMQPVQAMESDNVRVNNSTKRTITNNRYYDSNAFKKIDPRIGHFDHISEDAKTRLWDNICNKIKTFDRIQEQVRSNNYDELASEAIELLIARFAGETQKSLFGKSNKELDPKVLVKASKNVVDMFWKHLSKNNDLYGELPDGTRVTIYNKSLFKMFAEKCFPKVPVVTGIAITVLDNDILKNLIQNKLMETVFGYFQNSLKTQGITVKEMLGHEAIKFGHSMVYDESSVDFKELWKYLSPHLNHHLRNYMIPLLREAKGSILTKIESDLWYLTVPSVPVLPATIATSVASYVAGPALYTVGSYFGSPLLTVPGYCLGSLIGSAAAGATTYVYNYLKADSYFYATKDYVSQ